jgi:hypothetical protein
MQVPCIVLQLVVLQPAAGCVFMRVCEIWITSLVAHGRIASWSRLRYACGTVLCRRYDQMSLTWSTFSWNSRARTNKRILERVAAKGDTKMSHMAYVAKC